MQAAFGWWQFDPQKNALTNTATGQTVWFAEVAGVLPTDSTLSADTQGEGRDARSDAVTTSAKFFRFYYEDREIKAVLMVFARENQSRTRATRIWFLQHRETVVLHPHRLLRATLPYGHWRRIEDCVIDALLCWPEAEPTGRKPQFVVSQGGWFNGAWREDIKRIYTDWRRSGPHIDVAPFAPFILPLTAQPSIWQFIEANRIHLGALWAGVRERAPGDFEVDPSWNFTRLNGQMPFLRRLDGPAAMGLAGLDSRLRREDYIAGGYAFYADEDVFFCLGVDAFDGWQGLLSKWKFSLKPFRIAARIKTGIPFGRLRKSMQPFFTQGRVRIPTADDLARMAAAAGTKTGERLQAFYTAEYTYPSPELTHRVEVALTDGWMTWRAVKQRLLDDPDKIESLRRRSKYVPAYEQSGLDLGPKSIVRVEGRYVGGRFIPSASVEIEFEKPPNKLN